MKVGILSDSHGKTKRLVAAVRLLVSRGAEALVHCGDIVRDDDLAVLGAAPVPAYAVAGNMDRRIARFQKAAEAAGVTFCAKTVEVPIGPDRHLIAMHGDDEVLLYDLITGGQFPYVCHGHTHRVRDERIGEVRVIDPGALRHYKRPHRATCALLDTSEDKVEFIDVPKSA